MAPKNEATKASTQLDNAMRNLKVAFGELAIQMTPAERPIEVAKAKVASRKPSPVSLMPEGLVDDLSQQQFADPLGVRDARMVTLLHWREYLMQSATWIAFGYLVVVRVQQKRVVLRQVLRVQIVGIRRVREVEPLPGERRMHKIVSFDSGEPMALMASGTYRHYFDQDGKRYSHILDARSGKPVEHNTVSVAILHPDPTLADAWSTALLCLGTEQGLLAADKAGLAALFIDQQGDELIEHKSRAMSAIQGISFPER